MQTKLSNWPWMITSRKVDETIRKIILFGSYVRGATNRNSDLDVLVITEDCIESARVESVRVHRDLLDISMPMDILVAPQSKWEELRDVHGLIYREAWKTGKIVYESG
jgi:predicted nucleotidyltransferase